MDRVCCTAHLVIFAIPCIIIFLHPLTIFVLLCHFYKRSPGVFLRLAFEQAVAAWRDHGAWEREKKRVQDSAKASVRKQKKKAKRKKVRRGY